MKLNDKDREALIYRLSQDYADSLANDRDFRFQVARGGHQGFVHMEDDSLIRSAQDAGLDERYPEVERLIYLRIVSHCVDTALNRRKLYEMPDNARLVVFQCGFEPMVVAVWNYLQDTEGNFDLADDEEAEAIAIDYLKEVGWFHPDEDDETVLTADLII